MVFSSIKYQRAIWTVHFLWQYGVLYDLFIFLEEGKSELAILFYTTTMTLRRKKTIQPTGGFFFLPSAEYGWYVSGAGAGDGYLLSVSYVGSAR